MDNMHQPPGGDPQDFRPTQELGPTARPASPAAHPGPQPWGQPAGQPWNQPAAVGGASGSPPRRNGRLHGRALWWSAGLALAALLAGGGALAASTQSPAGPTGQAAVLNTMLSSANSPATGAVAGNAVASATPSVACLGRAARLRAAGHPLAARVALWRCGHRLRRIRALGGIHGQFTFETRTGARTIAYERGVIQSVIGADVVVQAKDGTTWTWVLGSSTVIREKGRRVAASALSDGENVFAGGPVVSGAYDARLIVIRVSSGSMSPSQASGS